MICEISFIEKDKGQKISAFSFLPLMNKNGTSLEDRLYDLAVYKVRQISYRLSSVIILPCGFLIGVVYLFVVTEIAAFPKIALQLWSLRL